LGPKILITKVGSKAAISFIIPVIAIPLIWPAYALVSGDMTQWFEGVLWQAGQRQTDNKELFDVLYSVMKTDPVLLILGGLGVTYLAIRREFIGILWVLPYFLLLYLVGWVNHFHLILIIPILCISIAKMIHDLPLLFRIKSKQMVISSTIIAGIVLFGVISTSILISTNLSYIQLKTASYIGNLVYARNDTSNYYENNVGTTFNNNTRDRVTIISGPIYSWVYKYALDDQYAFSHMRDTQPIMTEKFVLVVDPIYKRVTANSETENQTQGTRLITLFNNSETSAVFSKLPANYSEKNYPFTGINSADSGLTKTEIRKNY
jgi:hypothetical protein